MPLSWIAEILNWLSLPVLAGLAVVFLRRRAQRDFPFFFSYILAVEMITVLRLVVYSLWSGRIYFYVYWASDAVTSLLAWLAIYEVFARRLFARFYRVRLYRYLFPVTGLIVIITTFSITLATRSAPNFSIESRIFDFVRGAMLIFFVCLMMLMGREWSRYEFGISLGFGVYTIASLVRSAEWSRSHYGSLINQIGVIAWDVACCIWLVCFWKPPSPEHKLSSDHVNPGAIHEAREWQDALKTWVTRGKRLP